MRGCSQSFVAAVSGAVLLLSASSALAEIGVLAAVNRDMTGARPAEAMRPIFINERLVTNETIETSENGGGQVLFLDQTSLTISPNSSIVLDQYVYDPDEQTGQIGISVLKGAMRMVGGRITKTEPALIRTPSATIGIRGGIGTTVVQPDGSTLHFHLAGFSSTITTPTGTLTITREGGYASIAIDGVAVYLGIAPPEVLAAALKSGSGNGGSAGGGAVGGKIAAVTAAVSGASGAVTNGPISTTGQKLSIEFAPLPAELGEPPSDDFAAANVAEEMSREPTQTMDGIAFAGLYTPTIIGGMGGTVPELPFTLSFAVSTGEGIASFGFPDTGDPNLFLDTDPSGANFIADSFLVVTQNGTLVAEPGLGTFLGGEVDAQFTINSAKVLNGDFFVSYLNSGIIQGIDGLEGTIVNFNGIEIDGTDLPEAIDAIRDFLQIANQ